MGERMTRTEHITDIINDIMTEAGLNVLAQYDEDGMVAVNNTAYTFIVSEAETTMFEDSRTFQMTSLLMTYIDFKIDDFANNYTTLRNTLIQQVEDARVTADLTLHQNITHFTLDSQVPIIKNIAGVFDTVNRKGVIDILWEIKTISIPL